MMKAAFLGAMIMATTSSFAQTSAPNGSAGETSSATVADPAIQPTQQAVESGEPATGEQIAQIVEAEFPKYDREGSGELSEAQFSAWLITLRTASEPGATRDKPEVQAWAARAFAQADTDRSSAVSKAELTSFLSQGAG